MHTRYTAAAEISAALLLATATAVWSGTPHGVDGQDDSAAHRDTVSLGWGDLRPALANHAAWKLAESRLDESASQAAAAGAWPNPVVGARLGRSEAVGGAEVDRIWDVEVRVPVPIAGARRARIAVAAAESQGASHQADLLRRQAEAEVRTGFWRLVYQQERVTALRQSAGQTQELVQVAEVRVRSGEARPMELRQFEVELARVQSDLAEALLAEQTGRDLLRHWVGSGLPEAFRVSGSLAAVPEIPSLEEALAAVPARQSETRAAEERIQAAAARVRGARAERFADLEVGGFYERERDTRNYGAGLELQVPLWNWNGAAIRAARAGEAAARRRYELVLATTEAAVREQHAAATAAIARASALRQSVAPQAAQIASVTEQMYRLGESDVLHVLDARRGLIAVQEEARRAALESQLAALQLHLLTGDDLP